jgi:hypothetical protein
MIDFYSDKIYILYNLESEKKRIISYLKNYNINYTLFKADKTYLKKEVFESKDGYHMMYINAYKNYKLNKNQISHINSIKNILTDAINNNYNSITILEYDIYFHKNIEEKLKQYENLISNVDIIYLGSSQKYWYNPVNISKIEYSIDNTYYNANHSLGTFGIILKKNVFKMYHNMLSTYTLSSDLILTIVSKKFKSVVLNPNIVICDVMKSTILQNRNVIETFIKFKWNKNNYNIIE